MLKPYEPTPELPWDLKRVIHLHKRAGFSPTWSVIQRDLRDGPQPAIDRILAGRIDGDDASTRKFEELSQVIGEAAVGSDNINRLKAWWLFRMLYSPDVLRERMSLFWHNHFATSNNKVSDVAMMRQQNEIFRKHAFDSFSQTLGKAAKDPAMLLWLDAESNRKQHPNENLAREIMELFALGVGNYTEQDIKEAARALTGWSVNKGQFRDYDKYHDEGEKTIFGKRGTWRGDDLLRLLSEHAATPGRVAFRVTEMLMGETSRDEGLLVTLASGLREHDLDVSWAVETLLRSRLFFENRNIGNRVLSPVEYVVGVTRSLQYLDPPPSTLLLAETTANLGQDLFNPPNVFGWPGGRAWLTSRTMIARANFATSFVNGELSTRRASAEDGTAKLNAAELAESYGFEKPNEQETFFSQLLLGRDHSPPRLKAFSKDVNQLVAAILASPEAQLA